MTRSASAPRSLTAPTHRTSHRSLLTRVDDPAGSAPVDAVIVPATRTAAELGPALRLAAALSCPLLALCSHDTDAAAVGAAARAMQATAIAVDVAGPLGLPRLLTTAQLAGTPFARRTDTSTKRNLGLAITRMMGWQRVFLLDDDIRGVRPDTAQRAAALLEHFDVVGLRNDGYPDNSVVCHANRDTGGEQGTFAGAGAMVIPQAGVTSLFPDVYNEDWFFLLDGVGLGAVAEHGTFRQERFDPYVNPQRAGREEFGDCLAEGVFALFHDGGRVTDADRPYWEGFLPVRAALIDAIGRRLAAQDRLSRVRQAQIAAALRVARRNLQQISPKLCADYLAAWRHDRDEWRSWIERLPRDGSLPDALARLGIDPGRSVHTGQPAADGRRLAAIGTR
ncbi:hypothetical protein [Krasilnikovia sp. MM14-A1004]|uniref:hypothetical protein n=1 Tax=Krasilnikovia sp. MM14-A1004 TaxID=3373541 RepID=UPI00399C5703